MNRSGDSYAVALLIATLKANLALTTIVGDKIFWLRAPENTVLPYVVLKCIEGGDANDSIAGRTYEASWRVYGHTGTIANMIALKDAIYSALVRVLPIIPTALANEVIPLAHLYEVLPVSDSYIVQNNPLYIVGGEYRIKLGL